MYKTLRKLLVITLIAVVTGQPPTDVERAQILEAHLRLRETVCPPASDMLLMEYSNELEQYADYWASHCRFEHPDTRILPHYSDLGQSLAVFGSVKPSFTEAVCGYALEKSNYYYQNNTCNGSCDRYKRMIWASSNQLGCAMRQCDGIRPEWDNPQYLSVCQYRPKGNKQGKRPYRQGRSCSKCPEGHSCYRNQCIKGAICKQIHPLVELPNAIDRTVPKCVVFTS
ncbi:Cysteine-rich secretory protein LCCL domain-containing 2 [Taenia crassiceps]|uniref:Cysteine-rich secretory protein LCCL domain-containing 2 n=1 Tax=Taenia crassiceps TaxID=6207 RepID=A0ABR4Q068_9CEST